MYMRRGVRGWGFRENRGPGQGRDASVDLGGGKEKISFVRSRVEPS